MRVLGIDYGAKHVGIALGDTETKIATPWTVWPNEGALALLTRIHDLAMQEAIQALIVGIPRPLRAPLKENDQVREVRTFIEGVNGLGITVYEEDEAMSSGLAARHAQEMGEKGKRDDLAAAVILQTWLERQDGRWQMAARPPIPKDSLWVGRRDGR